MNNLANGIRSYAQITAFTMVGLSGGTALASDQKQDTPTAEPKITYKAACKEMTSQLNFVLTRPDMMNKDKQDKIRFIGDSWKFNVASHSKVVPNEVNDRIQGRSLQIIEDNTPQTPQEDWPLYFGAILFGFLTVLSIWRIRIKEPRGLADVVASISTLAAIACLVAVPCTHYIAKEGRKNHKEVYPTLPDDICNQIKPDQPTDD